MIVRNNRQSELNAENISKQLHCCSESKFRQGWEGNLPEDQSKTSQQQELDPQPTLILNLRCSKAGEFGYCGLTGVFWYVFKRFVVLPEQVLGLLERAETVESRKVGLFCVVSQRIGKRFALSQEMMGVFGKNQSPTPFSDVEPAGPARLAAGQHQKAITAEWVWPLVRDSCQTSERQHGDLVISHGKFPTFTNSKGRTDVEFAVHVQPKIRRRSFSAVTREQNIS